MPSTPLQPGEPLLVARAGGNKLLLPMRVVQRLHEAALPALLPAAGGEAPAFLIVGGAPVPVFFAQALLGAERVELQADDKLVELSHGDRRALLWVSAVEELVEFEPAAASVVAAAGSLVAGFAAAPIPIPVLDAERLLVLGESLCCPVASTCEV